MCKTPGTLIELAIAFQARDSHLPPRFLRRTGIRPLVPARRISASYTRQRLPGTGSRERCFHVGPGLTTSDDPNFCVPIVPGCLAHPPAAHHADLEADSIAGAPVVNICGADVATPVCAGLVPLRSLQTGSALRVTTGW